MVQQLSHVCAFRVKNAKNNALARLEQQNGNLAQVKVDEVLGLVCHVAAKVAADDAVPCWVVLFVKLFLNESSNVFLNVVFFKSLRRAVDGILLHVLRHVGIFNDSFSFGHDLEKGDEREREKGGRFGVRW